MSVLEKLQSETSALLASVKAIVDTVATHGALLTETKNATTLTQNIVNLLTTGNGALLCRSGCCTLELPLVLGIRLFRPSDSLARIIVLPFGVRYSITFWAVHGELSLRDGCCRRLLKFSRSHFSRCHLHRVSFVISYICIVLLSYLVSDESPMSPRADTLAGQLKALVVALVKVTSAALH